MEIHTGHSNVNSQLISYISYITDEVNKATIEILKTPTTTEEWEEISIKFMQRWNFPNGIREIDGKHIVKQQPKDSGLQYRNYKRTDSIILLGMIGPEYEFLYADVGINGRNSDEGNQSQSLSLSLFR